LVLADFPSLLWKEQGTLEALGSITIGMVELFGGMHRQTDGTARRAIRQAGKGRLAVLIERDGSDAAMTSGGIVDVPRIKGRIAHQVGRIVIEREYGLAIERAEVREVVFIERLGIFGQHDGSIA